MTANTILADINEIMTGYYLNGGKWFDSEAKAQYDSRAKQATPEEVMIQTARAKVMAKEFVSWANLHGYSGGVGQVWWTARPGILSGAVGREVDSRKNPTDILCKFSSGPADGFLGLSAKSTQTKGDIGFKNPGVGTVDKSLNLTLATKVKNKTDETVIQLALPASAKDRKTFIRSNAEVKRKTEAIGVALMATLRDDLYTALQRLDQKTLMKYLLSDWMDAEVMYPPYIKVTGQGNVAPFTAVLSDPVSNPKLDALSKYKITLSKVGNESIGVMAGDKKIMKMRFKFESEKMASSMKLSGDPW